MYPYYVDKQHGSNNSLWGIKEAYPTTANAQLLTTPHVEFISPFYLVFLTQVKLYFQLLFNE